MADKNPMPWTGYTLIYSNKLKRLSFETELECQRVRIILHDPLLAAVSVTEKSLPRVGCYQNHGVYTKGTSQPKRGEKWLLKRIDSREHASVLFIPHNLKLKPMFQVGADLLARSLFLLLQVAKENGLTRTVRCQSAEQPLPIPKSSSNPADDQHTLIGMLGQLTHEFQSPVVPEDIRAFVSSWAGLLSELRSRKRSTPDPSPDLLVDRFALPAERCDHQPETTSPEARYLAATFAPYWFVQRGLLDVIEHLAGITDSIAHHPNEWLLTALPLDSNASDNPFSAT
jgi:hypothetical protein